MEDSEQGSRVGTRPKLAAQTPLGAGGVDGWTRTRPACAVMNSPYPKRGLTFAWGSGWGISGLRESPACWGFLCLPGGSGQQTAAR